MYKELLKNTQQVSVKQLRRQFFFANLWLTVVCFKLASLAMEKYKYWPGLDWNTIGHFWYCTFLLA